MADYFPDISDEDLAKMLSPAPTGAGKSQPVAQTGKTTDYFPGVSDEELNKNVAAAAAIEKATRPLPENPQDLATYENMPYSEVAQYGVQNLGPSFKNAITAIPHMIMNPSETAGALGSVGRGFVGYMTEPTGEPVPKPSSATLANRNMALTPRFMGAAAAIPEEARTASKRQMFDLGSPEQQAQDRAAAAAIAEPFTSEAGFKKALATDPFTVLSMAAAPVTMGGGALSTAGTTLSKLGTIGKIANTLAVQPIATGVKVAGTLMDPVSTAVAAAKTVGAAGKTILGPGAQSIYTGAPKSAFETAYEAGKATDPILKDAFNKFATGEGSTVDFSQAVDKAVRKMRDEGSREWMQKKGAVTGAATQDMPFQPIYDAINTARADLPSRKVAAANPGSAADLAHLELDKIENQLLTMDTAPAGDPLRKINSLDKFKQSLWQDSKAQGGNSFASNAYKKVHAGVKKTIGRVSPEYDALMDQYQHFLDTMQNVTAASGSSSRTAANAQMAKTIKSLKTPEGVDAIEALAKHDPSIPYMAAGSALQPKIASGFIQRMMEGGGLVHTLGAVAKMGFTGEPLHALLALAGFGVQSAVQSPNLMGGLNYRLGQVAGSPVGAGVRGATTAAKAASPAAINIERGQSQQEPPRKAGGSVGRTARASGGKVAHNIQPLVSRLMGLAEQAKKSTDSSTKPLLDAPDASIVKALRVANQAI